MRKDNDGKLDFQRFTATSAMFKRKDETVRDKKRWYSIANERRYRRS